ncbi:aldehyde dehydrogenase family protein [Methanohalophilus sp.]
MSSMESINPSTGKLLESFSMHKSEDVRDILENSYQAFLDWKSFDVDVRCDYLRQVAKVLRQRKQECAELITREMGKPIKQSLGEIEKCALTFDYYADRTPSLMEPRVENTDATSSSVFFEPMGPVLCIKPWNFPFWQVLSSASHILAGGNTILLKHSSSVPACALKIEEIMQHAGLPEGVFQCLLIDGKKASSLISSDKIAAVSFTGGTEAGRRVAVEAASSLKKYVLELGGSDPFVVLEGADVQKAAKAAVAARFINTGQTCIAAKRFIVEESLMEEFKGHFIEHTCSMKVGDPLEEDTDIGPLVRAEEMHRLGSQVADSIEKGAKVELEGGLVEGAGFFYSPVVLSGITDTMDVMRQETFGPVAPLICVKDEAEAIKVANATPYGLGASIWGGNSDHLLEIGKKIQAGVVGINGFFKPEACMPFGGMKQSGVGRELSDFGFYEFMHIRSLESF